VQITRTLPAADGPLDNPLKGWAAYSNPGDQHSLPTAMAYFYTSWRELEPEPGRFAFDAWERTWDNPSARGKHVVLRIYLDYPARPIGVPEWVIKSGVRLTPYTEEGGGQSPDYDDPRLLDPLLRFIAAFGARYDRNPRVAFIALGTLGFWGEWHTYPRTELFASEATQQRVVDVYRRAFPHKILLARNPGNAVTGKPAWIGYHDDLFPDDTDGPEEWKFLPSMRRAGRMGNWKTAAIGAEMVPNAAAKYLGPEWDRTLAMLKATHLSWVGPYAPANESKLSPDLLERGRQMVRAMGYEYRLTRAEWRTNKRTLTLRVEGVNQGVAPFYYPWPVEAALLDDAGRVIVSAKAAADTDPRRWLPGPFSFTATLPLANKAPRGNARLAIGIRDQWTNQPRIRFANRLETSNGWTVLGPLRA
jgi:hypothetical protein